MCLWFQPEMLSKYKLESPVCLMLPFCPLPVTTVPPRWRVKMLRWQKLQGTAHVTKPWLARGPGRLTHIAGLPVLLGSGQHVQPIADQSRGWGTFGVRRGHLHRSASDKCPGRLHLRSKQASSNLQHKSLCTGGEDKLGGGVFMERRTVWKRRGGIRGWEGVGRETGMGGDGEGDGVEGGGEREKGGRGRPANLLA